MKNIILWSIIALVSIFFLFMGVVKTAGLPAPVFDYILTQNFLKYGLNRDVMFVVGVVEILGAILIWLHRFQGIGTIGPSLLILVTAGALLLHLRFDTFTDGVPALVALVLSAFVLIQATGVQNELAQDQAGANPAPVNDPLLYDSMHYNTGQGETHAR